jgi:hypothetical protein
MTPFPQVGCMHTVLPPNLHPLFAEPNTIVAETGEWRPMGHMLARQVQVVFFRGADPVGQMEYQVMHQPKPQSRWRRWLRFPQAKPPAVKVEIDRLHFAITIHVGCKEANRGEA